MEITKDLSFIGMIANASVVVQIILALLLLVSLMSWWHIFLKMFSIRQAYRQSDNFEREFWSSSDLNAIYQGASSGRHETGSMERIFESGFREFMKLKRQPGMENGAVMEGTRRAMRATYQREMDRLEANLPFLATVGSVSPYVGLFGTVGGS